MRILQGIVGCEAIALLVLLAMAFAPRDVAPPRAFAGAEVKTSADATAARGSVDTAATPAASTELHSERVDASPATAAGSVLLYGALLGIDPPSRSRDIHVGCRRGSTWLSADVRNGAYAFADLSPGTWRITCLVPGCTKQEFDHVIGPEPVQRLDITLETAIVMPLFLRTTDGARLQSSLREIGVWQPLSVIVTEAPLTGDLDPIEEPSVGDVGLGRQRHSPEDQRNTAPDASDGVLELDRPPPLHAALLLRHIVLAQQPILAGQREVRFAVDLAAVKTRFASLRARVIGTDGLPLAGAHLRVSSPGHLDQGGAPGDDGADVVNVLPGVNKVDVFARDLERYTMHVLVAPGEAVDLGDIVLGNVAKVAGRVVDADGAGVRGRVFWTTVDEWRPPLPMPDRGSARIQDSGDVELQLGRRRCLVRAMDERMRCGYAIVDPGAAAFTITVAETTEVRIETAALLCTRAVVVRRKAGDPLHVVRLEPRRRERSLRLPRGQYALDVHDGRGGLVRRMSLQIGAEPMHVEVP